MICRDELCSSVEFNTRRCYCVGEGLARPVDATRHPANADKPDIRVGDDGNHPADIITQRSVYITQTSGVDWFVVIRGTPRAAFPTIQTPNIINHNERSAVL